MDSAKWPVRAITTLLVVFSIASLLIAVLGQYAVVAFGVRRRTRDFGVRMALGASSSHILSAVLGEGLGLTAVGLVTGFVLSVAAGIALKGLLYNHRPGADTRTYAAVFGVLAGRVADGLLSARPPRHTEWNPMQALRHE